MVCRRWPGAGPPPAWRDMSFSVEASGSRCGKRPLQGSGGTFVRYKGCQSAYSPEITGLHEWARGELNHLTTPVNTGLQAADPLVRPI
jgi:hypothetical protein